MLPNDFKTIANLNTFKNEIKNGNLKLVLTDSLFTYTLEQNIKRLFNIFTQFPFTRSETELDHYHDIVSLRVASRAAERLKTKSSWEMRKLEEMP